MADELEKTCENCKYEFEDIEGTHCRHCIHNAEEHFEPKIIVPIEAEIRNQAIDEFAERLKGKYGCFGYIDEIKFEEVDEIAEQMKAGE